MLELINSAACLVLMVLSLPIAMVVGNRGMWLERMSIVAVQFGLFLQVANPWAMWADPVRWITVFLNVVAAAMLLIWRRRAWIFIRHYMGPSDLAKRRRRTDWPRNRPVEPQAVLRHRWHETPKA